MILNYYANFYNNRNNQSNQNWYYNYVFSSFSKDFNNLNLFHNPVDNPVDSPVEKKLNALFKDKENRLMEFIIINILVRKMFIIDWRFEVLVKKEIYLTNH